MNTAERDQETGKQKGHSKPFSLGMSSFNAEEQRKFGESVRLSMAFIHGRIQPDPLVGKAMPADAASISRRLKVLGKDMNSNHADLLELLVRYDDCRGWESTGSRHCAAWMNLYLGIGLPLGWEYLRVGRKLRELPVTRALFQVGQLTWSKVRVLSRVADPENESTLCHAALDASVTQVERLCDEYRWQEEDDKTGKSETEKSFQQWQDRSLTWNKISNGNIRISLSLPPEMAQGFLKSVEHSMSLLEESIPDHSEGASKEQNELINTTQAATQAATKEATKEAKEATKEQRKQHKGSNTRSNTRSNTSQNTKRSRGRITR